MLGRTLIAAAAALAISAGQALAASGYSTVFSFGDRLSDVGNVFLATGNAEPASPYANGQFSNGPVWVQDLAAKLGLPPLTPSLAGGTDYAFGGATTGFPATNNPLVPNFVDQVAAFTSDYGGVAPSTALYTLSIGANDLFGLLQTGAGFTAAAQAAAAAAASVTASALGVLESEGARKLVLFDVPDLGKTPFVQDLVSPTPPFDTVVGDAGDLSAFFDQQLLLDLGHDAPKLKVFDLNAYALIDSVVADPGAYGFSNATDPCYLGPLTGGGAACSDPSSYLFWDHVHPTEHGHSILADVAYGLAVPEPSSWAMMLLGFVGLGAFGARRTRLLASAA